MTKVTARVLVTGGAGFIGSHVVDRLVDHGYLVSVIDNLSTGKLENISGHLSAGRVDFMEGDVRDASLVKESVEDVDIVVHLAAVTSVPFSFENPNLTFEVNLGGTLNLLRSCVKEKVCKFVFVSSCAVYGEPQFLPMNEEHPTNPISPYGESKLAAEHFCIGLNDKRMLRSAVFRLFNVYGPRQGVNDYGGVISQLINRGKRGFPLVIFGDGSQTRDFVHVNDVVNVVLNSIENSAANGEVFNIGSGKSTSVLELAATVSELVGSNLRVQFEAHRTGDIKHSCANTSKAERLIGYKCRLSLKDGLRTLLACNVPVQEFHRKC